MKASEHGTSSDSRRKILVFYSAMDGIGGYPTDFRILTVAAGKLDDRVIAVSSLVELFRNARSQPLLVHVVGFNDPRALIAGLLMRVLRVPYVVSTLGQETPFLLRRGRRGIKYVFSAIYDRFVMAGALGRHVFSSWELRQGLRTPRHVLCLGLPIHEGMGFPLSDDRDGDAPEGQPVEFQFVGRKDIYQKGLDLLVDALATLEPRKDGPPLARISGASVDSDEIELRRRVSRAGLSSCVEITGPLARLERSRLRFFVYPSRFDGPPRPVRAALAAGIPVIVTDESGMSDDVITAGAGFVCGADKNSLARALASSRSLTEEAYQKMTSGAEQLAQSLEPSALAPRLVSWYLSVARSSSDSLER